MKKRNDLCNCYILPLLNLNKTSFGGVSNFINSWLSKDLEHVVVEVKEVLTSPETHEDYVTDFKTDRGNTLIVYKLQPHWKPTAIKFKEGAYSQFSKEAKDRIKHKSGLNYKKRTDDPKYTRTARELLALDKDPDLRELIEAEMAAIGVKLPKDAELISSPYEEDFYDLKLEKVYQGDS